MTENLDQLREVAQNAAELETEHGYTLPYVEAMRLMYGHLGASTVLALIDRAEAAEAAVQRVEALAGEWVRSGNGHWRDLHRALDGGE